MQDEMLRSIEERKKVLQDHIKEQRRLNRSLPSDKVRVTWDLFKGKISTKHFRRMFRMSLTVFEGLCTKLSLFLGNDKFKPEEYLHGLSGGRERKGKYPIISGEIKVAVSIRLLAGGSYLDLVPLFGISSGHLYAIFSQFLDWIKGMLSFPLPKLLNDKRWSVLEVLAEDYSQKTDGVFYGPFGSLDGLAVRIKCPSLKIANDPGNYYCRKGFYAVNVQAICDRRKRFLWMSPSNKGSSHDSAAFSDSKIFDQLKQASNELYERGLFIAGDSAYSLSPVLVVPYEKEELKRDINGMKDSFNFHLSSCRIHIECAFGELVMRWGILWRTLQFDLRKCCRIINACALLQNYIIENRVSDTEEASFFRDFRIEMDAVQEEATRVTGELPIPLVTDNNEPRRRGRPTLMETTDYHQGVTVRERLTTRLAASEMRRPLQHDMHYNQYGHIYMTS